MYRNKVDGRQNEVVARTLSNDRLSAEEHLLGDRINGYVMFHLLQQFKKRERNHLNASFFHLPPILLTFTFVISNFFNGFLQKDLLGNALFFVINWILLQCLLSLKFKKWSYRKRYYHKVFFLWLFRDD